MQNICSQAHDSVEALDFLHQNKIQFLVDVETILKEMDEINNKINSAADDFMTVCLCCLQRQVEFYSPSCLYHMNV